MKHAVWGKFTRVNLSSRETLFPGRKIYRVYKREFRGGTRWKLDVHMNVNDMCALCACVCIAAHCSLSWRRRIDKHEQFLDPPTLKVGPINKLTIVHPSVQTKDTTFYRENQREEVYSFLMVWRQLLSELYKIKRPDNLKSYKQKNPNMN